MRSAKSVGRIIGMLVFVHLATGLTVPYILLLSLTTPPAGFLANAAEISVQVRLSVVLVPAAPGGDAHVVEGKSVAEVLQR
jgi:hypothetical protein